MTDSTDNARRPELLPCPFCGSRGIDRDTYWHRDYCTNCGGKGPAAGNSVKAGWNTRADLAPDPLADARVLALVDAVREVAQDAYGYDHLYETTFHRDVHEKLSDALAAFDTGGRHD